jgi:predicted site-specific integrase-resolvase
MKLADDAQQMGVRYETAWRWFRDGKIQGRRSGAHTSSSTEGQAGPVSAPSPRVALYARVASAENQGHLDSQAERLAASCRLLYGARLAGGAGGQSGKRWDLACMTCMTPARSCWRCCKSNAVA